MEDMGVHHIIIILLPKCKETSANPKFALMVKRKTPLDNCLQSPINLLYARQARSDLPMSQVARIPSGQAASNEPQTDIVKPAFKNQAQATSN